MANGLEISAWQSSNRYITVQATFRNNHGSWNSAMDLSTCCNGSWRTHSVNLASGDGSKTVSDTYDLGTSTSQRIIYCQVRCSRWGNFSVPGDGNYAYVGQNVTIPASIAVPPNVSSVKAVRSADDNITITWTNNGSGTTAPTSNYVDVQVDDSGTWTNIYNGSLKTSHSYTSGSAGHKYVFRVNSYNAAGQNTHQSSDAVYTTPAKPTLSGFTISRISNSEYKLSMSVEQNSKYVNNRCVVDYGYQGGMYFSASDTFTITNGQLEITAKKASVATSSNNYTTDTSGNPYLFNILDSVYNSKINFLICVKVQNTNGSLNSGGGGTSDSGYTIVLASNVRIIAYPSIYVNVPSGSTMKAIYVNVPNATVSSKQTLYMDSDKASVSGNTLTLNQASASGSTVTIQK